MSKHLLAAALIAAGAGLTGCVDDYGYGGVAVGYGSYYPGYGYGYADYGPYYGWYDGFYYPGTGFYVYDVYRRPYRWNAYQQRYWEGRLNAYRGPRGGPVWNGFDRRGPGPGYVYPGQQYRGGYAPGYNGRQYQQGRGTMVPQAGQGYYGQGQRAFGGQQPSAGAVAPPHGPGPYGRGPRGDGQGRR